jgi:hypothetical protein
MHIPVAHWTLAIAHSVHALRVSKILVAHGGGALRLIRYQWRGSGSAGACATGNNNRCATGSCFPSSAHPPRPAPACRSGLSSSPHLAPDWGGVLRALLGTRPSHASAACSVLGRWLGHAGCRRLRSGLASLGRASSFP